MAQKQEIGPDKISFPLFFLKILAGGAGGVVGTLLLLLGFVLTASILPESNLAETVSPVFVFILAVMIFIASTIGNMLSTFLLALTEKEKYSKKSTAVYQVFVISLIIFLFMVPVYFISSSFEGPGAAFTVALHIILTAQISALTLEVISNHRYALVGVYGTAFSIVISAAILFGLASVFTPQMLLFAALPIVWGAIAMVGSIVTMIYGWLARIYDKDFLAADAVYGDDYGEEDSSDQQPEPEVEDTEGADFLKKSKD